MLFRCMCVENFINTYNANNFPVLLLFLLIFIYFLKTTQSPRKALSENETNLPVKVPKLKLMDMDRETDGEEVAVEATSEAVGAIAHKKSTYPFDPSKEPLLQDNPRRFVIFPIEYTDIWKMYKKVNY